MWTRGDKEVDERLYLLKELKEVAPTCFGAFILERKYHLVILELQRSQQEENITRASTKT
jgi:hypothetical protein